MAFVDVYLTDGSIRQSANEAWNRAGPYANLALETRLETVLNLFQTTDQAVYSDYLAGGYLNYGITENSDFRVDLDYHTIWYRGAFSTRGSYVSSVEILDAAQNYITFKGDMYWSGFPLFSTLITNTSLTEVGWRAPGKQEGLVISGSVILTPQGYSEGHINTISAEFTDANGFLVLDNTTGGDVFFDNSSGRADIKSGQFTSASFMIRPPGTGSEGVLDRITFADVTIPLTATANTFDIMAQDDSVILSGSVGSSIFTSTGNDLVVGSNHNDTIRGGDGNDTLDGGQGNDLIDGGAGFDNARFGVPLSAIEGAKAKADGSVEVRTTLGTDLLINIEMVSFADGSRTIEQLLSNNPAPYYQTKNGPVQADIYSGPVDFLEFQLLVTEANDVITGSQFNDFINLLGGDDAADGGAGRDVLDGGYGSNFLTGGEGADTFFSDGRAGQTTWTTITDFTPIDNVNIWGWVNGRSELVTALEGQGAEGFKGATYHYDLNGDGLIDTSVTFANLGLGEIAAPSTQEVAGNGYVLFLREGSLTTLPTYEEMAIPDFV